MGLRSRNKAGPYVPSYMDEGERCVVCDDLATGYHYRQLTCEGCKGFFRRTIQRQLSYVCKGENCCSVGKSTRNQCQQCRYAKCIQVGMATDLVLNMNQRSAKRQLIEENRERKRLEQIRDRLNETKYCESMTDDDRLLISTIADAFCRTIDGQVSSVRSLYKGRTCFQVGSEGQEAEFREVGARDERERTWQNVMTPLIRQCIDFAKAIPLFRQLNTTDQKELMSHYCWLELLLLHLSTQFDDHAQTFLLAPEICHLISPLHRFSLSMAALQLDNCELAMVATLIILNPDRHSALVDVEAVESAQERALFVLKKHTSKTGDCKDALRWPKLMLNIAELRAVASRLQTSFCNLDNADQLAQLFGIR